MRLLNMRVKPNPPHLTHQAASDLIAARIAGHEPVLIGRLGGVELECLFRHLAVKRDARLIRRALLRLKREAPTVWAEGVVERLSNNAGFFPVDTALAGVFSELMLDDMRSIDVLGLVETPREEEARPYLRNTFSVRLRDLEPYYHRDPWSQALSGKKVLVVHPFAQSIEAQYERRDLLFDDPRVLPEFELTVLQAVQSIAGTPTDYPTWFDAYRHMCEQMSEIPFDVAIVGCGAYGLALAAHAKRIGRKGVVLGGAVQILFGIKGRRWDEHEYISRLYNEHWVRPLATERPLNYANVEDGCYW
jgi:hypothetical protein